MIILVVKKLILSLLLQVLDRVFYIYNIFSFFMCRSFINYWYCLIGTKLILFDNKLYVTDFNFCICNFDA